MGAGRVGTQVVLLVSALWIPRALGSEGYGELAALLAMIAILQTASAFGFPLLEVRYLAPAWALGSRPEARALGSSIWAARLLLAVAGSAVLALWLAGSPSLGAGRLLLALAVGLALLRYGHEASKSLLLPVGRPGTLAALDFARAALSLPVVLVLYPRLGLPGVFAGLLLLQAVLLAVGAAALGRATGLRPGPLRLELLRPHLGFAAASCVAGVAGVLQAQFAVYAVANWVAHREAAYLGLAVQLYGFVQVFYLSARRALLPLLSELEERGELSRLAQWGEIQLRYTTAALCAALLGWALVGELVVRAVLGDGFAPVAPAATRTLLAVLLFCAAATCNGLLFVRGRARLASLNTVLYAAATLAGVLVAIRGGGDGTAVRIAGAYAAAAAVFLACAWSGLARVGGIRLPLGRAALLLSPALLVPAATGLEAGAAARCALAAALLVVYPALAIALRLVPLRELRRVRAVF